MKHLVFPVGLIVAASLTVLAQSTQPQQPPAATFRTAVDLVPVDVNIIDRTGKPVTGLTAADFSLMVDGRPRRIVSAEYIPSVRETGPVPPPVTHYSSNAASAGGRLMMIVVDQGNIAAGRGKLALDAASRFIAQLNPADRIGLVAIPGAGPQIDFTSNHAVVRSMLPKLVGMATTFVSPYRIGVSEAVEIERGNPQALQRLLDRECSGVREPSEIELCTRQLTGDAQSVAQMSRERTRNSLVALRSLIQRMSVTPSAKTLIFISEGLVIDRDFGELSWLGPAAARGQVVIYVLQLDQPMFEASSGRSSPTRAEDISIGEEGLGLVAGMTRGTVMRVVSSADNAFARLATELSGYYLLSFEPDSVDRDGKPHKIKIQVPGRSGVEIRARSEFVVETGAARTDEAMLAETLKAPLVASDIGLKLSAYTLKDPASDKLRIVMATEIDRGANANDGLSLAYMLVDAKGRLIASRIEGKVGTPIRPETKTQQYVGSMLTDEAGIHTLKVAVLDGRGRRGSVEHTFRAQLTGAGQIRATDLLIAENTGTASAGILPAVTGDLTTDTLHGYLELYSDATETLNGASVVFEVADGADGRALDGSVARVQPAAAETPNRRVVEASVQVALLPPGEYVARAIINVRGQKIGQVTRPFRVSRTPATVTAPGSGVRAAGSRPPIPFTSRIDEFDRTAVLSPQVVGFFLDRMSFAPGADAAPANAIEHARAGRFDAVLDALSGAKPNQAAAAFLQGLALYSRGELEPAAAKFREALRVDSEFFPAAFYLGSCFAAGGRDREAVGAWQTSLVTESDAPFIFTLLGDAMLRLRDMDAAIDILTEASTIWPNNEQILLRLGTAQLMAGKPEEGLQTLDGYLARNSGDHERHFLALRAIYEARANGRAIKSPEEDRALFARYAASYAAANGPQQPLVDQWRKFMDRK